MQNAVAGGTGWAGSAVVDALHTYGDEPVVLARPTGVRPKSDAECGLPASPIAVLPADRVALEVKVEVVGAGCAVRQEDSRGARACRPAAAAYGRAFQHETGPEGAPCQPRASRTASATRPLRADVLPCGE